MENHPIPQDITGFQFKLIGNMTVKQFAYVAVGGILSVISFYLTPLGLFRFLLMPVFGGIGAALAFLPIDGRPLDVMFSNFFRALVSPNQYLFTQMGGKLAISQLTIQKPASPLSMPRQQVRATPQADAEKRDQLQNYLSQMHSQAQSPLDTKELQKLQSLGDLTGISLNTPPAPTPQLAPIGGITPQQIQATLQQNVTPITPTPQAPVSETPRESPLPMTTPIQKTEAVDTQVDNILSEKAQEKAELSQIKQDIQAHAQPSSVQTVAPLVLPQAPQNIPVAVAPVPQPIQPVAVVQPIQQIAPAPMTQPFTVQPKPIVAMTKSETHTSKPAGIIQKTFAAPAGPNIIIGNVKDARGNTLSNILVEIKDKEGNPIRAFKTNVLGQFASATPLQNGSYVISLEDPAGTHSFTPIPMEVKGELIPVMEIVSFDQREALRQELFS